MFAFKSLVKILQIKQKYSNFMVYKKRWKHTDRICQVSQPKPRRNQNINGAGIRKTLEHTQILVISTI